MPDDSPTIKEPNLFEKDTIKALPDIPTSWERFVVLLIFGGLAVYMGYSGNNEAMMGFATTLATYFLARQGA